MRKGVFNNVLAGHLEKCVTTPQFDYQAELKIRGDYFKVLNIKSFAREAHYEDAMFEIIKMAVLVPATTANFAMYQGYEDMTLTIITRVNGKLIDTKTYVARATNLPDADISAMSKELINPERMDNETVAVVVLELVDRLSWYLRVRELGGIYPETDPLTLARYLLSTNQMTDKLAASDFNYAINYVDKQPRMFREILLDEGTPFLSAFDFLQNRYGIYGKGLGIFLYRQSWELFEPYNSNRFKEGGKRLVIYNVPQDDAIGLEKNFYISGDVTYIAATGESITSGDIDDNAVNDGTGVRFSDVRALEGRITDSKNQKLDPKKYLTEVNTNPRSYLVNAPMLKERFTDNPLKVSSDLYRKRGMTVTVQWENGIHHALVPGMGIEFIYPTGTGLERVYGTLLAAMEFSEVEGGGIMEKTHRNTIALTLMIFPFG